MNILFVASELTPLVKVGGLADVVGALPIALRKLGHDVRVLLPKYSVIDTELVPVQGHAAEVTVAWQGKRRSVTVSTATLPQTDVPLYFLDSPEMFTGDAIYYEHSGPGGALLAEERYVFFSWAASQAIPELGWQPEVVHCHDWHTGLLTALFKGRYPVVHTIHNMEGQGKWRAEEVFRWLGIHAQDYQQLEYRDLENNLNLLQLGIRNATAVNTVSPQYAKEILGSVYGFGLEHDLSGRADGVHGVLNGIDTTVFNPATDPRIAVPFTVETCAVKKRENRTALYAELKLDDGNGPLFGFVGRLTSQKGIDLLLPHIQRLIDAQARIVLLGSGTPELEQRLAAAVAPFHAQARLIVKFDASLAQRIYAASDFFLMPSRFEPCGLGQMIAMRYGALPIVRDTGGLHDTVRDLRHDQQGGGLVFEDATPDAFGVVLDAALRIYTENGTLDAARQRAMQEDFSWERSAKSYEQLYRHAQTNTR